MTDGFGEGSKIEVGIVLMLDIVVGYIGMPEAMHGNVVRQTNLLADFPVALAGAATDTAAKGEVRRSADILVFPSDGIKIGRASCRERV